jgi:peptidoglycan/xylan/chitin deacetylase (PgdA/CDA1 family)
MKSKLRNLYYSVAGNKYIRSFFQSYFSNSVTILMYHRVLSEIQMNWHPFISNGISISTDYFEEHIRYIRENYRVLTLDDYVTRNFIDEKKPPVIITFDDGYKDNLLNALPILRKYKIPAVIYVVTRFMEGDTSMWWYELDEICTTRQNIEFEWRGKKHSFILRNIGERQKCFRILRNLAVRHDLEDQKLLMERVRGNSKGKSYDDFVLNWNDVIKLDKEELITIAAHTHNHVALRYLSEKEAKWEMSYSRQLLEEKLDHSVSHFSYPFGTEAEAGMREYNLAKVNNFLSATTTINLPNKPETSSWCLNRQGMMRNDDLSRLQIKLSGLNSQIFSLNKKIRQTMNTDQR